MTTIYLVRHGQTYFNRYNRMQGWSDSPLTENGVKDAKRVGEVFKNIKFAYAASSDANRARNTAQIILDYNLANPPKLVEIPNFRECFYGYFEGMNSPETWLLTAHQAGYRTFNDLVTNFDLDYAKDLMHQADPFHEAETADQYWQRLDKAFEFLAKQVSFTSSDPVLLVTHGTTIRSIVGRYSSEKQFDLTDPPRNGSITTIEMNQNRQIKVKDYNKLKI
ncbi:histidine phosphatase family protein [Xylocopilactobacillus apicola]|uniref:Phosphoglycerate mutase n=1 Tax=Xylocopilactobacillus apicola TaxID=2932184 RepID=A0AAU9DB57_9LACO|nr:histidine phosphatase family protein [Xylocopilactobacillus apicola]BDR58780.1 phosphoglycerate mutase [Xylocopilactobacillus apicola]